MMYSGGSITAAEKGVIKNDILSPFPTSPPALSLFGSGNLKGYSFHAFFFYSFSLNELLSNSNFPESDNTQQDGEEDRDSTYSDGALEEESDDGEEYGSDTSVSGEEYENDFND